MSDKKHTKVLIIGSGPAGYCAAIYTARACLDPILIAGLNKGGQLTITTDVENYPGFAETIQGPWLMEQMEQQAKKVGVDIVSATVTSIDLSKKPFIATTDIAGTYTADSVIICTGAEAKWLGLPSEKKFQGFGVSGCATCDGFFYRGKKVAVIGGGNTAVEEALYLTNHASEVLLIHRRDTLRAEKTLQNKLFSHPKIRTIWNTVLDEVIGTDNPLNVTGARLKNIKTNEITEIKVDGIFIAIGHKPNTKIFENQIKMDEEGYIITDPSNMHTNIPGVFASGDVQDKIFRQAVTAAGTGCMAALEAERYLNS